MRSKRNNKTRNNKTRSNKTRNNKTKKQKLMKGGLWVNETIIATVLKEKQKKNPQAKNPLVNFDFVIYMLSFRTCKVEIIDEASLYSIVLKITILEPVDPTVLPFLSLEIDGIKKEPVYSIVLKLAILAPETERYFIIDGRKTLLRYFWSTTQPILKNTETEVEFESEAHKQGQIYFNTLIPDGKPSCLSVIDYSKFEKEKGKEFLTELLSKVYDKRSALAIQSVFDNLNQGVKELGIISMEFAGKGFVSFRTLLEEKDDWTRWMRREEYQKTQKVIDQSCVKALAQKIVVFLKTGIVNVDDHPGNILVNLKEGEVNSVRLIDFGASVDFSNSDYPNSLMDYIKKNYKYRIDDFLSWRKNKENKNKGLPVKSDIMDVKLDGEILDLIQSMHNLGEVRQNLRSKKTETEAALPIPTTNIKRNFSKISSNQFGILGIGFLLDLNPDSHNNNEIIKRMLLLLHIFSELDFAYNVGSPDYQMEDLLKYVFLIEMSDASLQRPSKQFVDWFAEPNEQVKRKLLAIYDEFIKLTKRDVLLRPPLSADTLRRAIQKNEFLTARIRL